MLPLELLPQELSQRGEEEREWKEVIGKKSAEGTEKQKAGRSFGPAEPYRKRSGKNKVTE